MPGKTPSKLQHYAIIGRTLLLRDCPLRSQPLLVLPWTKFFGQRMSKEMPSWLYVGKGRTASLMRCVFLTGPLKNV
jgi:hypothetical protein